MQPRAPLLGRRPKPRYSNNDKPTSTRDPLRKVAFNSLVNSKGGAAPFVAVSVALRGSLRYKKISAWSKKNGFALKIFSRKNFDFFRVAQIFSATLDFSASKSLARFLGDDRNGGEGGSTEPASKKN